MDTCSALHRIQVAHGHVAQHLKTSATEEITSTVLSYLPHGRFNLAPYISVVQIDLQTPRVNPYIDQQQQHVTKKNVRTSKKKAMYIWVFFL